MNLHTFNLKSSTNKEVKISGYASVFGKTDHHNDVIIQGAFADSIAKHHQSCGSAIKLLWQHDHTKPIGIISNIIEDNKGLLVEACINKDLRQTNEIVSLINQGAVDSLSIGFNIEKSVVNQTGEREIFKATLWEISIVTFPANSQAKIYRVHNRPSLELEYSSNIKEPWITLHKLLFSKSKTIFKL